MYSEYRKKFKSMTLEELELLESDMVIGRYTTLCIEAFTDELFDRYKKEDSTAGNLNAFDEHYVNGEKITKSNWDEVYKEWRKMKDEEIKQKYDNIIEFPKDRSIPNQTDYYTVGGLRLLEIEDGEIVATKFKPFKEGGL